MIIQTELIGRVVLIRLNRPDKLNALNSEVMSAITQTLTEYDQNPDIGCFVITGSERAFAAGADIAEMSDKSYSEMLSTDYFSGWDAFCSLRTPKIAAVSGYALGGGCELAMMCDLIYAAESALFGQPEIKLGVIPGIGGTQRLTRLVGRAKAMDLILTGRMMDALEAERAGLVARVMPDETLLEETLAIAKVIASYSKPSVLVAKEAIDRAEQVPLKEGLLFERRVFHSLFATSDQKEGMHAFLEKRAPNFQGH
ncbi:Enoyl-CoA hydratase [Vibrio nigripulchritudo MADA3029]|uniref:enoyl-CoA hydratase n=2 Tax=Vibrio nigripulchritudo TaxID=28173 RepID=U4KEG6_9VIBR|nr:MULTISPECIES: enoyl-CoA hydratase-related protein [Vibrio]EGU59691.1 enoyl-CoA hydratase/isomerase [Vibrio nigripulchritudo ATCC 27043]KJY79966.1 enoyl-CoA hydratase [Vibrio nigripulchritudo]UAB69859.1 enoyl-CoA hydratase/isomerase family protein [Vibrio sp. SCSIO 43132]CCN37990.1 Enoyl-CoA hydratase [Vibrio nigripulchritudo AM115]CCN39005.1 Enoyl-CoA hydratase [Vibrio nigripulchritudo FTn2]